MSLEMVGYLGGLLVTISLAPQIVKSFITKSTKDISIVYTLVLAIGLLLWVFYGVLNNILPLIIFASVELFFALSLIVLKLIYK